VKTEVTTNITTKDSDGDKKVIQTKEVEEVQTIQLKMQTQSFKQGYKRKSSTGNCYHKNYRKRN
jgi:hypothetical protein